MALNVTFTTEYMKELRSHWKLLMQRLNNPPDSQPVFQELIERHSERHRAYHNLDHILMMHTALEELGTINPEISLGIWFHDAIYNPTSSSNEAWSGALAKMRIERLGLSERLGTTVHNLVLATKHTEASHDSHRLMLR